MGLVEKSPSKADPAHCELVGCDRNLEEGGRAGDWSRVYGLIERILG